ncbi:MAG: SPOR domain-containing protein [Bacteroidales bacterium]|nr:SPOR domain-containing protein [Bacteroidales bacterium]
MKKLIQTVLILLPVALTATGCDFFRMLAGRPTSAQIAAMAEAIRLEESARIADSLRKALTDTTPVQVAAEPQEVPAAAVPQVAVTPAPAPAAPTDDLKRFYIVMASFGKVANARNYASSLEAKGYPATILKRGGYQVVAVCGTDDEAAVKQSFDEIRRQDFCPQGVWIIDRKGQ